MTIAFRANTKVDLSNPTTVTLTKPTGTLSTDVVIGFIATGTTSANTPASWIAPAGWTEFSGSPWTYFPSGVTKISIQLWWGLGNLTFTNTFTKSGGSGNQFVGGQAASFSGCDNSTQPNVIGSTGTANNVSSVSAPAITSTVNNCLEIIVGSDHNDGNFSATGFTALVGTDNNQTADLLYGTSTFATGSNGPFTVNNNSPSNALLVVPFAIQPPSGVSGQPLATLQAVKRSAYFRVDDPIFSVLSKKRWSKRLAMER